MALKVSFQEKVQDDLLRFAVIIAVYNGQFIFCRHRKRNTLEIPGGHREEGETIHETAARELYEETGAVEFWLRPISVYCVTEDADHLFADGSHTDDACVSACGMLYIARVYTLEEELHSEIAEIYLRDQFPEDPDALTYPLIQPLLIEEAEKCGWNLKTVEQEKEPFRYIDAIPSQECVLPGQNLNLLGGLINRTEAPVTAPVHVWGRIGDDWKSLTSLTVTARPGEHRHVYFTIPGDRFTSSFWQGKTPEDVELRISHRMPEADEKGKLIFVEI